MVAFYSVCGCVNKIITLNFCAKQKLSNYLSFENILEKNLLNDYFCSLISNCVAYVLHWTFDQQF